MVPKFIDRSTPVTKSAIACVRRRGAMKPKKPTAATGSAVPRPLESRGRSPSSSPAKSGKRLRWQVRSRAKSSASVPLPLRRVFSGASRAAAMPVIGSPRARNPLRGRATLARPPPPWPSAPFGRSQVSGRPALLSRCGLRLARRGVRSPSRGAFSGSRFIARGKLALRLRASGQEPSPRFGQRGAIGQNARPG